MSRSSKFWLFIDLSPDKQYFININSISSIEVFKDRTRGDTIYIHSNSQKIKVIGEQNYKALSDALPFITIEEKDEIVTISGRFKKPA